MRRQIIKIDEEKCDGCGRCVPACAEGAIQIIDGKAKLVSEVYCDGLGACLGECPRGAITIEEREAEEFDPEAVRGHLKSQKQSWEQTKSTAHASAIDCGCPGSASQVLRKRETAPAEESSPESGGVPSQLGHWPVQLCLVPVQAPYFQGADLLIAADCVPVAYADFHRRFLTGRTVLVGCPKFDDVDSYHHKLTEIFRQNDIRSVEMVYMEVPCCFGLVHLVQLARQDSGKAIPITMTKIGIRGDILERSQPVPAKAP